MRPRLRPPRLLRIVGEVADGGRKVVVFSYFRDVLKDGDKGAGLWA
ncbi:hypothetical protein F4554_005923 [Actinopolymorpha rutila]|uniref:Uncharacterized protein n=1 Tax=Actinopolymorpha rutila TaxID=446787 RepID=A0A852ZMD5_9ACTN|nr:hypothetical protein [Actinopolymorpha rutila]